MPDIPGRILLVNSNPLMLSLERGYFSRQRINVASAQSAGEALKMLPALRPQVVILAYELGDMCGAEACAKIKQNPHFQDLPVLILSPKEQYAIDHCWEAGCDGVLIRPVHRRELASITQDFINLSLRTAPRVDLRVLVRFGLNGELDRHDYSVNLSCGGLYLASHEALTLGQGVKLEFLLPGREQNLACHGRIAWLNQGEDRTRTDLEEGFGIEFMALHKDTRRSLQQFVMESLRAKA